MYTCILFCTNIPTLPTSPYYTKLYEYCTITHTHYNHNIEMYLPFHCHSKAACSPICCYIFNIDIAKKCGPRSNCSRRSSLIWVQIICLELENCQYFEHHYCKKSVDPNQTALYCNIGVQTVCLELENCLV